MGTSGNAPAKKTLLAKAFYSKHGFGDGLLTGWHAAAGENDSFVVVRNNGTKTRVHLGQEIAGVGAVSLFSRGILQVGPNKILIGENLDHQWRAKKLQRKGQYLFKKPGGGTVRAQVGETIAGLGVLSEDTDKYGNLAVVNDGKITRVAVEIKQLELKLLVYAEAHEGAPSAHLSYFNLIEPGQTSRNSNGVRGAFFARRANAPAKFCEIDADGSMLNTAVFWPSRNREFLIGRVRSAEDARIERGLFRALKELERQCEEFGVAPSDNFEYAQVLAKLERANKEQWKDYMFSVTHGQAQFGIEPAQRQLASVRELAR